ncbi:PREDICTED: LOW QUALITY PROTEIN: H19 opposite tumor suppressor [Ceratotherium simum simum]|uniref:LOW QUALITY PROTEIN: H19 opposite tumor suppressor n=1 Tax=Ceratotherium simum simum TaxID=73337 RepID=A0ABM1DHL1_CERSS|nr:PREDICTED: LOW QUALITY PROTEIN: H19 opposite tumor suppressor [Ceratotherium simum simum]
MSPGPLVEPWWGGAHSEKDNGMLQDCSMVRASRLGKGRAGPHTLSRTLSPPERDGPQGGAGAAQAEGGPATQQLARTLAQRLKASSRTPTSANDLVQIEFRGDGGNGVLDALSLLSKGKREKRCEKTREKVEEEQGEEAEWW